MEIFVSGDRVVALNTDMSGPICGPTDSLPHIFRFPDGSLRRDLVYHVALVGPSKDGNQSLFLTGLHVFLDTREIGWNSTRFRKVDVLAGHVAKKRRRKNPATPARPESSARAPKAACDRALSILPPPPTTAYLLLP